VGSDVEKYTMKKWILFIAAILLVCSSVARADDIDDGVKAYDEGNYVQALKLLQPLATQGNAVAQYNLGVMYARGKGVIQDYQEARKWWQLAAKQGEAAAQYNLGWMYRTGDGVTQDYEEARKWYRLAAEQGYAPLKRKFIGARTKEYRFARYVEDWRIKVEHIGNLNYPEAAKRDRLYGNVQLTVGIMADGNLESIEINRSSGKKILDEAAIRIVKLAGQNGFAPFPPDISRDTDILHITRTWFFTRSDELRSSK